MRAFWIWLQAVIVCVFLLLPVLIALFVSGIAISVMARVRSIAAGKEG
jgi:hypothetical protein